MTWAEEVLDALRSLAFRCHCGLEHYNLEEWDLAATMLCMCGRRWAPRGSRPVTENSCYAWYFVGRK